MYQYIYFRPRLGWDRPMLDFPGPWTGSSSSTHPPTGQPVRHATFNTTLPTGQSALRCVTPDTTPPTGQPHLRSSSRLAPARRFRRPTHPRPPSQLASPSPPPCRRSPEGEPLWHHRATRRLPGVGYPPEARSSTTPRAGRRSAQQAPRHRHAAVEPLP